MYSPSVECYGSIGSLRTAGQDLIDMIPISLSSLLFGPSGLAGVQVKLPRTFRQTQTTADRNRFYAKITTVGNKVVTGRWFDLWTSAVAINSICVGNGKAGLAIVAGGVQIKIDRRYIQPSDMVSGSPKNASVVDTA